MGTAPPQPPVDIPLVARNRAFWYNKGIEKADGRSFSMNLGENIKHRREELKLSQEAVAERLGVSRQAVSKWETGLSEPTAGNLIQLAEVLETSLSALADPEGAADGRAAPGKEQPGKPPNPILRANLTKWAIILQAGFLRGSAVFLRALRVNPGDGSAQGLFLFSLLPLAACSAWMASNHRFETNHRQRRKNYNIEFCYCVLQVLAALLDIRFGLGLLGAALMIAIGVIYLLYVNPKFMGRKLTR